MLRAQAVVSGAVAGNPRWLRLADADIGVPRLKYARGDGGQLMSVQHTVIAAPP